MSKKVLFFLRIIIIIFVLTFFLELGYFIYISYFKDSKSIYFDSINSISSNGSGFLGVGSNNNNEKHFEKAKFTKYDSKLNKSFEKIYNKGYNGVFFGVVADSDGYVAVGSYEDTKKNYKNSTRKALIVKYNKNGDVIFENSFSSLDNSKFVDVLVVDDGYLVVGQSVYEKMTLGNSTSGGAFLIKYDKSLKLLWKSNFGSNKSAIYNSLLVDDDFIYAVGQDSFRVGLVSKYDMKGNLIDSVTYDDTDGLGFTCIGKNDKEILVSGSKYIDDYSSKALMVRYDGDLNYLNEVTYGVEGNNRFNKFIVEDDFDIVAIGTKSIYDKSGGNSNLNVLSYDGIIGKYKSDLKEVSVIEYGEDRDAHFTDIKRYKDGYLVSAYSSYEDQSYMSKFIIYSDALKVLEVQ